MSDARDPTPQALEQEAVRPFALDLDEFIAARSDAPAALIGSEEDNLLPTHGLLLLVAKGGKGKTTLTIDQAFHLASGVDWLGFEVERPLRVLFIENEGPREPFRSKLELRRDNWPHSISGGIYVYDEDWGQAKLNETRFVERLNDFVASKAIDLVIGDPLDTFGMEGVGSPEDTRNMVALLKQAGLFSRVAWELLHHSQKASVPDAIDEASGAWGGKPDTLLVLERKPGNRSRLSFPKVRWSRRGEREAYVLSFEPDAETFELVEEQATEERDLPAEIEALLAERPNLTTSEIAAKKGGIGANQDDVRDALQGNPGRFRLKTADEAKALGRRADAKLWDLTRQPAESLKSLESPGVGSGVGDLLTPPCMGVSNPKPGHPSPPIGMNTAKSPESVPTQPGSEIDQPTEEAPVPTDDELADIERSKAKLRKWEGAGNGKGEGADSVETKSTPGGHAARLRALGIEPLEDVIGSEAHDALRRDVNRGAP